MKMFFRQYGEGQPIIILHGLFGISDNWVTIGRRLAEKFEVYIPDQRNHGQSPHSSQFDYANLRDDLYEFIQDHQLFNPILIGHSMGGKVAMNFALEYPHKIDKLIVVDISTRKYTLRPAHKEIANAMLSVDFDKINTRSEVDDIISNRIKSQKIKGFVMKNLYRLNENEFAWRLNIKNISDNFEEVFTGIQSPYTFDKDTLFIKGGFSDYIQDTDIDHIQKAFPNAQIQEIEGASHWVHAEKPNELCSVLSAFLNKECSIKKTDGEF